MAGKDELIQSGGNWNVAYYGVTQEEVNQLVGDYTIKSETGEGTYNLHVKVKDLNKDLFAKTEAIAESHNISLDNISYNSRLLASHGRYYAMTVH